MPKYTRFEELPVWQEAARLYNAVLDLLEGPDSPFTWGFRNQLDRAALSISNNVAEGFERMSTKELIGFLAIARASAGEVRSMIAVVRDRPKLVQFRDRLLVIRHMGESCARQITAWISSIEKSPVKGKRHRAKEGVQDTSHPEAQRFKKKAVRGFTKGRQ
jgi:four helix bundle protein